MTALCPTCKDCRNVYNAVTVTGCLKYKNRIYHFTSSVRNIAKSDYYSFVMPVRLDNRPSVRLHGTTRLQPDDFFGNRYLNISLKICRENSMFIKIWQEKRVLYIKTIIHFSSYLAQLFSEGEMFQTKVVKKIKKKHTLCSVNFFFSPKIVQFIMRKNILEPGRPQTTTGRKRTACWCLRLQTHPTRNM
jgi:hypothetical protein